MVPLALRKASGSPVSVRAVVDDLGAGQHRMAFVEQIFEALGRADPLVIIAGRADLHILLELLGEDHRPATLALVPEIVGGLALGDIGERIADAADPGHATSFAA
jgi:hypothetical protein